MQVFLISLFAVAVLLLTAVPGYLLIKRKLIGEDCIAGFSKVLIYVTQPCLVIYSFKTATFSLEKLREIGIDVEVTSDDSITVTSDGKYRATTIRTNPYPGFPTDLQPQFGALLCLSSGASSISEGIWTERFRYTEELKKMGAYIELTDGAAHFTGVPSLHGANVRGSDLRAGAALVIAALMAEGVSTVSGLEYIDRGYEDFAGKLKRLGADIRRE